MCDANAPGRDAAVARGRLWRLVRYHGKLEVKAMREVVLMASMAAAGLLLLSVGCTAKSTKRVTGSTTPKTGPWVPGDSVVIDSINGGIEVNRGSGDSVAADFTPFVLIGYDATDEEEKEELEKLKPTLTVLADEDPPVILVKTVRQGQVLSSLGADIDVRLPAEFDGRLEILQNNGPLEVNSVAQASDLVVESDNGSCEVHAGGARMIDVFCDSGGLTGSIGEIPEDFVSASLRTGRGNIQLDFPSGRFVVQAYSRSGGIVDVGNAADAGCSVDAASDSSKTITCGDANAEDPLYVVTADDDEGAQLTHDIELSF
jgi:hypothetical protein